MKESNGEWNTDSCGVIVKYKGNLLLFEGNALSLFTLFSWLSSMFLQFSKDGVFLKKKLEIVFLK